MGKIIACLILAELMSRVGYEYKSKRYIISLYLNSGLKEVIKWLRRSSP
mgnify:CR=1 FL=1